MKMAWILGEDDTDEEMLAEGAVKMAGSETRVFRAACS